MNKSLSDIISSSFSRFSKGQRLIAEYILEHIEYAAYMTAAKLGQAVGVSESTVVRFAVELGYDGYPELQKQMKEHIKSKLTASQRMNLDIAQQSDEKILERTLSMDLELIRSTLSELDISEFTSAVDTIISAKRQFVLGARSSYSLAYFMSFYFNHIFESSKMLDSDGNVEIYDQLVSISEQDVLIAISFPRYSKRTLQAVEFVKKQGATIIAITDSADSTLAEMADITLIAKSDMASFADSLVAPMSLINAVMSAIGKRMYSRISQTYERLEALWNEHNVYENG